MPMGMYWNQEPCKSTDYYAYGGSGEIRTHGRLLVGCFQDSWVKPLPHASTRAILTLDDASHPVVEARLKLAPSLRSLTHV